MLLLQCAAARKKILFRELRIRAARGEGAAVSCLPERRKDPGRKKMEQDGKRRSSMEQKGKGWYAHGILKICEWNTKGILKETQLCDSIKLQEWNTGMGSRS